MSQEMETSSLLPCGGFVMFEGWEFLSVGYH